MKDRKGCTVDLRRASAMKTRPSPPRWVGDYVIWWGGDDCRIHTCVRCGSPLRSAKALGAGYGPNCAPMSPASNRTYAKCSLLNARQFSGRRNRKTNRQAPQPRRSTCRDQLLHSSDWWTEICQRVTPNQWSALRALALQHWPDLRHASYVPRRQRLRNHTSETHQRPADGQ